MDRTVGEEMEGSYKKLIGLADAFVAQYRLFLEEGSGEPLKELKGHITRPTYALSLDGCGHAGNFDYLEENFKEIEKEV